MEGINPRATARKNDQIRKTFSGALIILTSGVDSLEEKDKLAVLEKVRNFKDFDEGNDPYGEHDFGEIWHNGVKYYFKFDYFNDNFRFFREDGNRVLTIMMADEY